MSAIPGHQDWGKPCTHIAAWNAVTTHTRTSAPENGPDFCAECSDAIQEWVPWPCARSEVPDMTGESDVRNGRN